MDTVADTFPSSFLAALEPLRLRARSVPAGGQFAAQRARSKGSGIEFADVRPYVPGDDLRALDGAAWLRTDRLFTRLFVQEEDLPVHILVDRSASLGAVALPNGHTKRRSAMRLAASLAYIALRRLDRVTIRGFAGEPLGPLPTARGPAAFQSLLERMVSLPDGGTTDVRRACAELAERSGRRGLCVLISDFLDPSGIDSIDQGLGLLRHRLALVRVTRPGEERPDLSGALDLEDVESGHRLAIDADSGFADRYAKAYREFGAKLRDVATRRGALYLEHTITTVETDAVAEWFAHGAFPG